jgi:hypothetical protein
MTFLKILSVSMLFIALISGLGFLALSLVRKALHMNGGDRLLSFNDWPAAFTLGGLFHCLLAFALSALGVMSAAWHFFALFMVFLAANAIIPAAASIQNTERSPTPADKRPWINHLPAITFTIMAFFFTANCLLTMTFPQFDIDMVAHILMRSKVLTDSTFMDAFFFHDPVFANVHANYPPLAAFLFNLMFNIGINDIGGYNLTNYVVVFLCAIALNAFFKEQGILALQRSLWTTIFLSTGEFIGSQFIMSSTDILLSLAILLSTIALIKCLQKNSAQDSLMFSFFTAAALLIKTDGIMFAVLATGILGFRRPRALTKHLVLLAVIIGPWYLFRLTLPDPVTGPESVLRGFHVTNLIPTASMALKTAAQVMARHWYAMFLIVWPVLILARKNRRDIFLPLAILIGGMMAAYGFSMWSYIGKIPSFQSTFLRLLVHTYPLAVLAVALAVAQLLHRPIAGDHAPNPCLDNGGALINRSCLDSYFTRHCQADAHIIF